MSQTACGLRMGAKHDVLLCVLCALCSSAALCILQPWPPAGRAGRCQMHGCSTHAARPLTLHTAPCHKSTAKHSAAFPTSPRCTAADPHQAARASAGGKPDGDAPRSPPAPYTQAPFATSATAASQDLLKCACQSLQRVHCSAPGRHALLSLLWCACNSARTLCTPAQHALRPCGHTSLHALFELLCGRVTRLRRVQSSCTYGQPAAPCTLNPQACLLLKTQTHRAKGCVRCPECTHTHTHTGTHTHTRMHVSLC